MSNIAFDLLGINELFIQHKSVLYSTIGSEDIGYAIGYIKKTNNFDYIDFTQSSNKHTFIRIIHILASILFVGILSFVFKRHIDIKIKVTNHLVIEKVVYIASNKYLNGYTVFKNKLYQSFLQLLRAYFIIFKSTFSIMQIILIVVFWISSFFVTYKTCATFFIPSIFLISFDKYEKFVNIDNIEQIKFICNATIYSIFEKLTAKILILGAYFIISSLPLLLHSISTAILIIIKLFTLVTISISINYILKNIKYLEIIYIIIFTSYLSGHPIIQLF